MEIIVIGFIILAMWFFLSGRFKTNIKDPETLRDFELENAYIDLKKSILVTSAYKQEQAYQRLYYSMKALIGKILERHQHLVLDVEAKYNLQNERYILFKQREHHDIDGFKRTSLFVPRDIDLDSVEDDLLIYLCFFLYHGGQAKNIGQIESDNKRMLEILDYLIEKRNYYPASFFKGLVMKYGIDVYSSSKPNEAKALLEFAKDNGVGSASIELAELSKYFVLENIKSVNF